MKMAEKRELALDGNVRDFIKTKLSVITVGGKQIKVTAGSQKKFYRFCINRKVNPLQGDVYAMPFWNNELKGYDVMPVIDYKVYIKWASLSGKLSGFSFERLTDDESKFIGWKIYIQRKDWDMTYSDELYLESACKKDKDGKPVTFGPRRDDPEFMTKKQLIRQAIQLTFPEYMFGDFDDNVDNAEKDDDDSYAIIIPSEEQKDVIDKISQYADFTIMMPETFEEAELLIRRIKKAIAERIINKKDLKPTKAEIEWLFNGDEYTTERKTALDIIKK